MKSIESIDNDTDRKIQKLLDEPASSDYNYRQIQLALERFVIEHPDVTLDHDRFEQVTLDWATSVSREGFHRIAQDPGFSAHPRFHGDVSHITLDDLAYALKTGEMPRE